MNEYGLLNFGKFWQLIELETLGLMMNVLPLSKTNTQDYPDLINTLVNYGLIFLVVFLVYVSAYQSGRLIRQKDIRRKNQLRSILRKAKIEDIENEE